MITLDERYWGFDDNPTGDLVYRPGLIDLVYAEMFRAIEKHTFDRTPANPDMSIHEKMTVLTEEVGEVARACTYDEGSGEKRLTELIQVAAMALMFAAAEQELLDDRG